MARRTDDALEWSFGGPLGVATGSLSIIGSAGRGCLLVGRLYYNDGQAARKLNATAAEIQILVERGLLHPVRISTGRLFLASEIESLPQAESARNEHCTKTRKREFLIRGPGPRQSKNKGSHHTEKHDLRSDPWVGMLSLRVRDCLAQAKITTLSELQNKKPEELLSIPRFGPKCLEEVNHFLGLHGMSKETSDTVAEVETGQTNRYPTNDGPGPASTPPIPPEDSPSDASVASNKFVSVLSTRTLTCLHKAGISSLGDLCRTDKKSLMGIQGFGVKCLAEIEQFLQANNLPALPDRPTQDPFLKFYAGRMGADDLAKKARALLQKLGIQENEGLLGLDLRRVLEATGYDEELTDAVWFWYGLPNPRDEQDLLALLVASGLARNTLRYATDPEADEILDALARCLRKAEIQTTAGTLHERAVMDWGVLQALNKNFSPPASTLAELLARLQQSPQPVKPDAVRKLEEALDIASLDEELGLLLASLTTREAETLRQRLTPSGQSRTLKELAEQLGVSRERVRQLEKEASKRLRHLYYWELPLPRTRTAMLLIWENGVFAMDDIFRLLHGRGLAASKSTVVGLITVWRALSPGESGVADTLRLWRAVDPRAHAFPEEILSLEKTGLSIRQRALAKKVSPIIKRWVRRTGAVTSERIGQELDEGSAFQEDVLAVLLEHGLQEILPGYWVGRTDAYSIPVAVTKRMLSVCGPLDLRTVRRGLVRHQNRLGFPVFPAAVLGAVLGKNDGLKVGEDGVVRLQGTDLKQTNLSRSERVWLQTVEAHGPVVHTQTILRAFARHGLEKATASRLMWASEIVQRVGKCLYSLPGAQFTQADLEAGQAQAIGREWAGRKRSAPPQESLSGTITSTFAPQPPRTSLEKEAIGSVPPHAAYEGLRGHLRYDAQENRLAMVFPEAAWPGDAAVRLIWDGREVPIPSAYSPSDDSTVTRAVELPIGYAVWQAEARMVSEGEHKIVRLPRFSRDRGLVFKASDGRAVGRWRSGKEYCVVTPAARFSEACADIVFGEWRRLGRPEGWPEHLALRVRVGDPSAEGGGAAAVIERYGRATEALGLPGLEHMWSPRGRLVGEPAASSGGGDAFLTREPPHLEVDGLWDSPLAVSLARWDPGDGEFVERDALLLPASSRRTLLVALWGDRELPKEGRYRVEVGGRSRIEFELVEALPPAELDKLEVRLRLAQEGRERAAERTLRRRDLERATLLGRAWPAAKLTLRASCGAWSRTFGATTDEEGLWSVRWRDLGARDVPEGPLELTLSWRGLVQASLVFADSPRVDPEDVALRWRGRGDERSLVLEGSASCAGAGAGAGVRARAVLLGPRPWAGEVWSEGIAFDEHGGFEARFRPEGEIRWLVVLPDGEFKAGSGGVRPWLVQAQDEDRPLQRYPLADLLGPRPELWEGVASQLRGAPLPPALERLLDLSALGRILEKQGFAPAGGPRWRPAEDRETLERLAAWAPFGLRAPVALFSLASSPPYGHPAEPASSCLTVGAGDLAAAIARGGGEMPVGCATPDGNLRRVESRVVLRREGNAWALELIAGEQLHVCPRCGLVLPPGEFWNHRPPSPVMRPCSEGRRTLRLIGAGRGEPVRPLLRFDREGLLPCIEELVRRVTEGREEDVPAHAGPWLDRVQEAYFEEGEDLEPADWFASLRRVKSLLDAAGRKDHDGEDALALLGRAARFHESGLGVLAEWLRSEEA